MLSRETNITVKASLAFIRLSHGEPRFKIVYVQVCVYMCVYTSMHSQVTKVKRRFLREVGNREGNGID